MREKLLPLIRKMPFETNCKVSIHKRGCCWDVLENFNPIMLFPAIHHNSTSFCQILKFNLISLSMCSKKSARDTPITRKKSIFIFSICLMTWFFFISAAALLQSLTPNTTLHKTSFWWCRLLLFSLLVPSATAASCLSTIQHTQKEQL